MNVTKNNWELVVGGGAPNMKIPSTPDSRAKYKRASKDKKRYNREKESKLLERYTKVLSKL